MSTPSEESEVKTMTSSSSRFKAWWMDEETCSAIRLNLSRRLNRRTRPLIPPHGVSSTSRDEVKVPVRSEGHVAIKSNCDTDVKRSRSSSNSSIISRKRVLEVSLKEEECEAMEVDDVDPGLLAEINDMRSNGAKRMKEDESSNEQGLEAKHFRPTASSGSGRRRLSSIVVVLDTNVMVAHLTALQSVLCEVTFQCHVDFYVPWIVLCELDGLKRRDLNNIGKKARDAINFLHEALQSGHPQIKGQTLDEEREAEADNEQLIADDRILYACRSLRLKTNRVLLFTNDKQLINKAAVNEIKAFTASKVFNGIMEQVRRLQVQGVIKVMTKAEEIANALKAFKALWHFLFVYTRSLGDALRVSLPSTLPPLQVEEGVKFSNLSQLKLSLLIIKQFVVDLSEVYEEYMKARITELTTESASVIRLYRLLHAIYDVENSNNDDNCLKQLPCGLPPSPSLPLVTRRALRLLVSDSEEREKMEVGLQQLNDMRKTLQNCYNTSSQMSS